MFTAQPSPAATATPLLKNPTTSCDTPKDAPVLFAVPAPSSVGKGLLCLCRKVYWTSGSLMHCAYAPVTKDEAAKLLRDPSVINILSNPVTGSNLLTVAGNGAIIGVQQTVGYLHPQSTVAQKQATRKLSEQKSLVVATASAVAPNEAQKVPSKTAALPQPTTTPTSANERTPVDSSTPLLPKIDAVFTLADTGINSATLNGQDVKVSSTTKVPSKEATTRLSYVSTEPTKQPHQLPTESTKEPSKETTKQPHQPSFESTKVSRKQTFKQSHVLSDVQNKVEEKECHTKGNNEAVELKRKSCIEKSDEVIDKKRQLTTTASNPSLKVKFSWNKRWSAEEVIDSVDKPNTSDKLKVAQPPSQCPVPKRHLEAQTSIPEKPSPVQVGTAWGNIVIHDPRSFKYSFDTEQKMVTISGQIPKLSVQKKLKVGDLVKLGCHPSGTLFERMAPTRKGKIVKKQTKQLAVPSLDALTRHPDFKHIPTDDKVTYLKVLLKMQRAALGISV